MNVRHTTAPLRANLVNRPDAIANDGLVHPRSLAIFHRLKLLVGAYLGVSVLTLAAIILMRNNAAAVTAAVWTRGIAVVVSAVVLLLFTVRAAQGSRQAYLRLRLVSAIMVVVIAVIIALPGTFPLWMKIEQGVCGLFLIGVAVVTYGKHLRSLFAKS